MKKPQNQKFTIDVCDGKIKKNNQEETLNLISVFPTRPQYHYDLNGFNVDCTGELTVKISLLKDENMISSLNKSRLNAINKNEMLDSFYCTASMDIRGLDVTNAGPAIEHYLKQVLLPMYYNNGTTYHVL